jgi:hypothetical protein
MTTEEILADAQHTCTVLEQVLGGLVAALDDLIAAGLLEVPALVHDSGALVEEEAVTWFVFAHELREATELLGRLETTP